MQYVIAENEKKTHYSKKNNVFKMATTEDKPFLSHKGLFC